MWPWFDKSVHKRAVFCCKLFVLVASIHLVLLSYLLLIYRDSAPLRLIFSKQQLENSSVIFLPFHKSITHGLPAVKQLHHPTSTVKQNIKKKSETKKSEVQLVQKKEKKSIQKIGNQKKSEQKILQDSIAVEQNKKIEPVKKIQELKQDTKSVTEKKEATPILESKVEKPIKEKLVENKLHKQSVVAENKVETPVYIGQHELQALQLHDQLAQEIALNWRVPPGLPKNLICEIALMVDGQGNAQRIRIEKSSGILMYDMAARNAISRMKLPRLAWGKEIQITFKQ